MRIDSLLVENFRNLTKETLLPHPGVNVLYGDNAQGKTNLLEAIWLFTGDKSFRGALDSHLVTFGATQRSRVCLDFFAHGRRKQGEIILSPQKRIMLNEIPLRSRSGLSGEFYCVLFSPVHLGLIKYGPEERRRFIDQTICQLKPKYMVVLRDFHRVLSQRNALLKEIRRYPSLEDTLEVWDLHLARLSATIIKTRYTYLEKLKPFATQIYDGLCSQKEKLEMTYLSLLSTEELPCPDSSVILDKVREGRQEDVATGISNLGAHRDDVEFLIDGRSARLYASQGQQRSIVLALKLAECEMIAQTAGEQPVVLLDDVMSELDESRRSYLLNHLEERQIFITCCDPHQFEGVGEGKGFALQEGRITQEHQWNLLGGV